jgi:type IV fimbrial biogenesis protein FimT
MVYQLLNHGAIPSPFAKAGGFSLIELMIVLAIMGLLLVLGVPSFSLLLQNAQVRTAAESVENGLNLARTEAVRRNARVSFNLNTPSSNDWTVSVVSTGAQVQQRTNAGSTANAVIAGSQDVVTFNGLGRVTPPPGDPIVFTVTNPTAGDCQITGPVRCLDVTVLFGGKIKLCDPAVAAADPRAC